MKNGELSHIIEWLSYEGLAINNVSVNANTAYEEKQPVYIFEIIGSKLIAATQEIKIKKKIKIVFYCWKLSA